MNQRNLNRPWHVKNEITGEETKTNYNVFGEVSKIQVKTDASTWSETTYSYNGLGQLWQTVSPDPIQGNASNTRLTETYYDASGNLLKTADIRNRGVFDNVIEYEYDKLGRQTKVKTEVATVKNSNGTYANDVDLETINKYNPDGSLDYTYVVNMGSPVCTSYTYDNLGRTLTVTTKRDPDLQNPGSTLETLTTTYGYDALGNLLFVCDSDGNQTGYEYLTSLHMINEYLDVGKDGSSYGDLCRSYVYNDFGQLIQYTNRNSQTITYDPTP